MIKKLVKKRVFLIGDYKKTICFICPKAYPLFNNRIKNKTFGGAEVQISILAKHLANTNKNLIIKLLTADYGQNNKELYKNIEIWKSFSFNNNTIVKMKKFFSAFLKLNADIYIQRTMTSFSWLIALLCKIMKKKFIYMIASDSEVDLEYNLYKNRLSFYLSILTFKFSSHVISQNERQKKILERNKINNITIKSSCEIIHNHPFQKNKEYYLWIGRADEVKQPEIFIELAKLLPNINFVMICPKSTNLSKDDYSVLIDKAKKYKNLTFINHVDFLDTFKYYKEATGLINTSIYEGFSSTFIEAGRFGTPIISLNVNPDNFLVKYNCGFVCDGNIDELKNKVILLENNNNKYHELSGNIYQYVKNNHDIEKNSEEFLKLL
ncbi:MAG: glycosyltransferase [Spirochaetes bacterium]|nr:glycosyltransferase [Spirochaetota bacterium]